MAVYATPKEIVDGLLTLLRAYSWSATLVWRKGPQRAFRLAADEEAIGFVRLTGSPQGEQSAGSGNHWWQWWSVVVQILVPDDLADPDAVEDLMLDLMADLHDCLHTIEARTLLGGAKVGSVQSVTCGIGPYVEGDKQNFRWAEWTLSWRTLRA